MGVPCKSGLTCELIKFASDGVFAESRCYAKIEDGDGPEACLDTFSRTVLNQAIAVVVNRCAAVEGDIRRHPACAFAKLWQDVGEGQLRKLRR